MKINMFRVQRDAPESKNSRTNHDFYVHLTKFSLRESECEITFSEKKQIPFSGKSASLEYSKSSKHL